MFDDLAEAIQHAIVGLGPSGFTCLQLSVGKESRGEIRDEYCDEDIQRVGREEANGNSYTRVLTTSNGYLGGLG